MNKKSMPTTSKEAYKYLDPDKIREMYKKIANALIALGPSTYEEISDHLNEKPERVWKRMSECNRIGLAHRNGDRKVMKSGRQGFVWVYGHEPVEKVQKKERVMKGKTVADFSRAIKQVQVSQTVQAQLF